MANEVWLRLSALLGVTSNDGKAEIERVRYYMTQCGVLRDKVNALEAQLRVMRKRADGGV